MQQAKEMNQRQIDSRKENNIFVWISKDYYVYQEQEIEYLQSPLGNNESIAQVVNDLTEGFYKDCLALFYNLEDKRIILAFANREGGNQ